LHQLGKARCEGLGLDLAVVVLYVLGETRTADVRTVWARALLVAVDITRLLEPGWPVVRLEMPVELALRDVLAVGVNRAAEDSCLDHAAGVDLSSAVGLIITGQTLMDNRLTFNRGILSPKHYLHHKRAR
jgi:hypothetical protein